MTVSYVVSRDRLFRFCEEHARERVTMQLLAFWGRHPNAKLTLDAVSYALDFRKSEVDRALKELVQAELVDTYVQNSLFYRLTLDEARRQPVLELASIGLDRWVAAIQPLEQKHEGTATKCGVGGC